MFARTGKVGPFRPLPLVVDASASQSRFAADLPIDVSARAHGSGNRFKE